MKDRINSQNKKNQYFETTSESISVTVEDSEPHHTIGRSKRNFNYFS